MQNATLLVMSSDAQRKEGFVRALSEAGWEGIASATSLSEAVKMLRDTKKACAIVDTELDDISGLKAVPILRSLCRQIKIIFTAPENSRDLEERVRATDIFYYHVGPADSAELAAAVNNAIGAPTRGSQESRRKVLVVDDDPDFHMFLRTVLAPSRYSVISAYSQREGLDVAREETPDVILLDIIMESTTDGFAFCREARRDPRIRHTPILGISAIEKVTGVHFPPDSDPDLFPVDGFLNKPVTPEMLFSELKRLLPVEG